MRLVLLGPPGAGKGTLASLLTEKRGIAHISTGDILRDEMKNNTDLGTEAKKYIEKGELVPDALVIKLIEKRISRENFLRGYMLDGFPRTEAQAKDLDAILEKIKKPLDYVFYMEASLNLILKRLTGRRVCRDCGAVYHTVNRPPQVKGVCDKCGSHDLYQRADDNEATIKNRMDVYLNSTKPVTEYYRKQGKLKTLDGDKESEQLEEELMKILHENR